MNIFDRWLVGGWGCTQVGGAYRAAVCCELCRLCRASFIALPDEYRVMLVGTKKKGSKEMQRMGFEPMHTKV
jgi:hypothetical protein